MLRRLYPVVLIIVLLSVVNVSTYAQGDPSTPTSVPCSFYNDLCIDATPIVTESTVVKPKAGPSYTVLTSILAGKTARFESRAPRLVDTVTNGSGFNAITDRVVDAKFRTFINDAGRPPLFGGSEFIGTTSSINYRLYTWSDDLLSVQLYGAEGLSGTYPKPYSSAVNYSLRLNRELTPQDIFRVNIDHETELTNLLLPTIISDLVKRGVNYTERSVRFDIEFGLSWNISPGGLVIAAGSYGKPYSVTVPFDQLRTILAPNAFTR